MFLACPNTAPFFSAALIHTRWGLIDDHYSYGTRTFQGIDYVRADDPRYYADAWVVPEAFCSAKNEDGTAASINTIETGGD